MFWLNVLKIVRLAHQIFPKYYNNSWFGKNYWSIGFANEKTFTEMIRNCKPFTNCFNFSDYKFVSKECLFEEIISRIFWWNILEKNSPNKLQVRWKVTMPFEVECNCGKSVYQIWSKPYWTSVRRKKLECCGQMAVGRVPCPRSVLQLNSIFRNERAFVHCAKGGASSCGILYRQ